MALTQPAGARQGQRVVALLACHNRRESTLASLHALEAAAARVPLALSAVLVDDGSHDGTAAAVRAAFDWVEVIEADGSLYWCRSMHRAFARALEHARNEPAADAFLWLNDDTLLAPDGLVRLHTLALREEATAGPERRPVIVVGTLAAGPSPNVNVNVHAAPSYGGRVAASRWRRTAWRLLPPREQPQRLDTMDGNLVWINAAAAARVGNLDARFEHAMGDVDYGLRARALGVPLWLAPGLCGHCAPNPAAGGFTDRSLPLPERWRAMLAPKGLPWRSWLHFTRRHAGLAWPLFFAWPYLRTLASACLPRRRHAAALPPIRR